MVDPEFKFDVEFDVFEKSGSPGKERRIGGFVTTDDLDQQGERLLMDGLDFGPFLKSGWFNDNHSRDTTGIVGHPIDAKLIKKGGKRGWYVTGYLLKGTRRADEIWELANALQKSDRRLGFSVEGKIQKRIGPDRKTIAKAIVKNVAITNCPVNDKTSLEVLAKSLGAFDKALSVGPAVPYGVSIPGSGATLIPESLEGYSACTTGKRKRKKSKLDTAGLAPASANGGLSKSEGIAFILAKMPQITPTTAARIYRLAKQWKRRS